MGAKLTDEADAADKLVAPPYPAHLNEQERSAVALAYATKYVEDLIARSPELVKWRVEFPAFMTAIMRLGLDLKWLQERIEALEAGAVVGAKYLGTHQRAQSYRKHSSVTYSGNLWIALDDVGEGIVPGSSALWQLAAKPTKAKP